MSSTQKWVAKSVAMTSDAPEVVIVLASSDRQHDAALERGLQAAGHSVLLVDSGRAALDAVYEWHPDLLILDSGLDDINEHGLCEAVKEDDSLGFLPVIALVEPDQETREDLACVADVTLPKPVEADDLLASVRSLLRIKVRFDRVVYENQTLVEASRAVELLKSDIITNVSHELSTPLVQVKAAVSLLAEDLMQNRASEQAHVADMAMQAVTRLESSVDNIRQLAQTHNIKLGPVVVTEAAQLAIRHLDRSWASRGAGERIQMQIDEDVPLVRADKRALARLLQLLLDNALKFSPDDSPVYVLAERDGDDRVWIGVQDSGIGIAEEEHSRIFDAFYQIDGSSTRRYGGTGTGLALALLFATGMHTAIQLESVVGEGSTFSFLLPVADLTDLDD